MAGEEKKEEVTVEEAREIGEELEPHDQEKGEVSINAVLGLGSNAKTIKIQGWVKNCMMIILIDSGSTYSFVDP